VKDEAKKKVLKALIAEMKNGEGERLKAKKQPAPEAVAPKKKKKPEEDEECGDDDKARLLELYESME
jgi:dsDNA-binding SOS-regulon protein